MLTDSRALSVVTTHTHTARSLPSLALAMFTECQSRDTCVDDSCCGVCRTCRLTLVQLFSIITLVEVYVNPVALYQVYEALVAVVMKCCMSGPDCVRFRATLDPRLRTTEAENGAGHWSPNIFIR